MKVIERSQQRLRLEVANSGASAKVCTIDRAGGLVDIRNFALMLPYCWKRVPLSNVTGVSVRRPSSEARRSGNGKSDYYAVLELRIGKEVPIGAFTKEDALQAARTIRDFLKSSRTATELPV